MNNKEAVEKVDNAIKSEFFKRCYIGNELAEALGIVVRLATKASNNDTPAKPIGDLINREALKDVIKPYKGKAISTQFILDIIDKAPPVDVSGNEYFPYRTAYFNGVRDGRATARPRGEWIKTPELYRDRICSHCKQQIPYSKLGKFCVECGADMRGGATSEKA